MLVTEGAGNVDHLDAMAYKPNVMSVFKKSAHTLHKDPLHVVQLTAHVDFKHLRINK